MIKDIYDGKMRPFGKYHIDTPRYKAGIVAEKHTTISLLLSLNVRLYWKNRKMHILQSTMKQPIPNFLLE